MEYLFWTEKEENHLREVYKTTSKEELAKIFYPRTKQAILLKAKKLKLWPQNKEVKFENRSLSSKGEKNGMFGKVGPNKGKKMSKATKEKISIYRKANPISMPGCLNPMYGKPSYWRGKKIPREFVEAGLKKRKENYEKLSIEEKKTLKEERRLRAINALINKKRVETLPEKKIREILEKENISFEQEKKIKYYSCDFVIGDKIIEVQGDYWHANPKVYNLKEINKTQKQNVRRDKAKKTFLEKKHKLLYLWEKDITINIEEVTKTLLLFLS